MKVVVVILAVIAFIVCLFLGLHLGELTGFTNTSTPVVTLTPTLDNNQQHTIVLIQADDLSLSSPRLVGVWLVFFYVDYPKLTLLLLYPPMGGSNQVKSRALGQQFSFTSNGDLSPNFVSALHNFDFQSDGTIITDSADLVQWINWLGGISYNGSQTLLKGSEVLLSQPTANPSNRETGSWMKLVATGACGQLDRLPPNADWKGLISSMTSDHFRADFNMDQAINAWDALASRKEHLSCEVVVPN